MVKVAQAGEDATVKVLLRALKEKDNPRIARITAEHLRRLVIAQIIDPDPFVPPPAQEDADGEIEIGSVRKTGCPFGFRMNELSQHTLVVGRSGSGKTTLIKTLLRALLRLPRNAALPATIIVFDIKRDFGKKLLSDLPEIWVFRIPGNDFRWNPLQPPISNWRKWAGIFASTFANSCGFYGGMSTETSLFGYLLDLYSKYDPDHGKYPCLLDLQDYLGWLKGKKKFERGTEAFRSYERILNRTEGLCAALGETINCSCGYDLTELLRHHIIFDLAELKPDAQTFLTECFLTGIVWRRIETGERGGELRTLCVFDEAKRLMPAYREDAQQAISNMSNLMAQAREFGIGFLVGECDPALLANSVKSNCYARFCFNQTNGKDVLDSAGALGLSDEQASEILKLEVGEAIVRLAGRINRPFVVRITK
jgi:hypothetical protein